MSQRYAIGNNTILKSCFFFFLFYELVGEILAHSQGMEKFWYN